MKHTKPIEQQTPWSMKWYCPYCGKTEAVSMRDFIILYGYQWQYKEVYCDYCKEIYYFDN